MIVMERPGMPSGSNARATPAAGIVAARRPAARRLGMELAGRLSDPERLVVAAGAGFARLADDACRAGQRLVAPGIGPTHGVRTPLLAEVERSLLKGARGTSSDHLLLAAHHLLGAACREEHWLAIGLLAETLRPDPERTWQLLRRAARDAGDWITVDTLARAFGRGVLAEPYRWAELEQLVYSPSRWERRLVGSTIATIPFIDRDMGRRPEIATRALAILADLMGDADPEVQKALAWAYRSLLLVDQARVEATLVGEADQAAATGDGHRAWVLRDVAPKLRVETADQIGERLSGIRRRRSAPSTSRAAATALAFGVARAPADHPEPPLLL
jgi:3-methyladenine DNA glycosylase AlkD